MTSELRKSFRVSSVLWGRPPGMSGIGADSAGEDDVARCGSFAAGALDGAGRGGSECTFSTIISVPGQGLVGTGGDR